MDRLRLLLWRRPVEPTAREQRDTWIEWMELVDCVLLVFDNAEADRVAA